MLEYIKEWSSDIITYYYHSFTDFRIKKDRAVLQNQTFQTEH